MQIGKLARYGVLVAMGSVATVAHAWVWHGLKDAQPVAGPSLAEKDLIGKVVLVYCFTSDTVNEKLLKRTQALSAAYDKAKFAVVGSCKDATGVAELVRRHGATYPVYRGFRVVTALEKEPGTLYFVNEYGRLVWQSRDTEHLSSLEAALDEAVKTCGKPPSLTRGVTFVHYRALKDRLVLGENLEEIEGSLRRIAAGASAKAAEAKLILDAVGRGMEETIADIRVLMDIDAPRAFQFLDLYLKSFPRDRSRYAKLYEELKKRK